MLAEQDLGFSQSVNPPNTVRFVLRADPIAIRDGLIGLFALDLMAALTEESAATVQIVLAEIFNNIAEHAYPNFPGLIEVWLTMGDSYLFVRIMDNGLAMPGGVVPGGKLACCDDLPEGGFGWSMIRNLAHELTYQRDSGRNMLCLCIGVDYQSQ